MKIIKWILISLGIVLVLVGSALTYLMQPSGKVSDFQAWQPSPARSASSGLTVRFFGVSTLLLDDGQDQILIDGFFSRPGLWQVFSSKISGDVTQLKQLKEEYDLERTGAILITHSHYDHALDLPHLSRLLPQATIIGSNSSLNIARANPEVKAAQFSLAQAGQTLPFGQFKVTPIPSAHTPPTPVNDDLGEEITTPLKLPAKFSEFKEGGSFDYLIEHAGQKILVKASTGFIPNQLKGLEVDTLFLGIAQLSRQSQHYQEQYLAETLQTLKPQVVVPIHWDNFFQPLEQPLEFLPRFADHMPKSLNLLIQAAEAQGTQVVMLTGPQPYLLENVISSQSD